MRYHNLILFDLLLTYCFSSYQWNIVFSILFTYTMIHIYQENSLLLLRFLSLNKRSLFLICLLQKTALFNLFTCCYTCLFAVVRDIWFMVQQKYNMPTHSFSIILISNHYMQSSVVEVKGCIPFIT